MKYITMIFMVLSLGCSLGGTGPGAVSPDQCAAYDEAYLGWSATSMVASGLAGAGAILTPIVQDNEDAVLGIGISAGILGALGTAAGLIANMYASRYTEMGCAGPLDIETTVLTEEGEEEVPTVELPVVPDPLPSVEPVPGLIPESQPEAPSEPSPDPEPVPETPADPVSEPVNP